MHYSSNMFVNSILSTAIVTLVMSCLIPSSAIASSEWVGIASSEDDLMSFYVLKKSIKKSGNLVEVIEVVNTTRKNDPISLRVKQEYNCSDKKLRTMGGSLHSGHYGNGALISRLSPTPSDWKSFPVGSTASYIAEFICK